MKNISIQFVISIIAAAITQPFLPWWTIALTSGLIAWFFTYKYSFYAFLVGFLAAFILWGVYAYLLSNSAGGAALPVKIGQLFGGISGMGMVGVSALVGGLVSGFGALTGNLSRRIFV